MPGKITTLLMFDGKAEEAIKYYVSLFRNSVIKSIDRYNSKEAGEKGTVKLAIFSLNDQDIMCIDSSGQQKYAFTPAISLHVNCESEEEIQTLFTNLSRDGKVLMDLSSDGFCEKCGWVEDKFGISWQLNFQN